LDKSYFHQNKTMVYMDLASPELIHSLLDAQPIRRPRASPHSSRQGAPRNYATGVRRTASSCRCGACATCADNARWEEIFEKKFADPNYYSRRTVQHASPLNEILHGSS
jgi:hypothetical protein